MKTKGFQTLLSEPDNTLTQAVLVLVCMVLILPFVILAHFDYPAIDDFAFVHAVNTSGFWNAQFRWYTLWTGRYASSFFMSTHPLLFNSFDLYKIIAALFVLFSVHATYFFVRFMIPASARIISFALAVFIAFCFFDGMPSLSQGIYWFPGSVTYQLGNILSVYLLVLVARALSQEYGFSRNKHILICVLIFLSCGTNETTMIGVDGTLFFIILYRFLSERTVGRRLLVYLICALAASAIVILAPGNALRDLNFDSPNKHNVLFTLTEGFAATIGSIGGWLNSPVPWLTFIFVFFSVIKFSVAGKLSPKQSLLKFLFFFVTGFAVVYASFFTGFWSLGGISPPRTVNVGYWLFIFYFFGCCVLLARAIKPYLSKIPAWPYNTFTIPCSIIMLALGIQSTGNYQAATSDLLSGNASAYGAECWARHKIMRECADSICEIPAFRAIPVSVFYADMGPDVNTSWNIQYAEFYQKKSVRVIPANADVGRYLFNFDDAGTSQLYDLGSIASDVSFSEPNAVALRTQGYGPIFSVKLKELNVKDYSMIRKIRLSEAIYSADSVVDAAIVVCISEPGAKTNVFWTSADIVTSHFKIKEWCKKEAEVLIDPKYLLPENVINIYIWNRIDKKIYVDDFGINFY